MRIRAEPPAAFARFCRSTGETQAVETPAICRGIASGCAARLILPSRQRPKERLERFHLAYAEHREDACTQNVFKMLSKMISVPHQGKAWLSCRKHAKKEQVRLLVAGDAIPPDARARVGQAPARQWPWSRWKLRAWAQTLKGGKTADGRLAGGFN